ncbi:MAG TPA: hypothetical protein VI320_31975, partial [Terracidiphilus sp.]
REFTVKPILRAVGESSQVNLRKTSLGFNGIIDLAMFYRFYIPTGKEPKNSDFNWPGSGSYLHHFAKRRVLESYKKSYIAKFPTMSGSFKVSWIHIGSNSRESSVIYIYERRNQEKPES